MVQVLENGHTQTSLSGSEFKRLILADSEKVRITAKMAPCRPSFFRLLLDPSAPHLPLPPDFVTKHLVNKIPTNPIIRSENGNYSWRLKITKIGENYCFSDGWNNVVRDAELTFGDFIIFRLVDQTTFKVLVYSPNGCEKDLPSKTKVEQDASIVDDEDEDVKEYEEEIDDDDDNEDEDDEDEDDGDGDIDGDDGDPFFTTIISKSHKNMLRLPLEFVRLAGIDEDETIMLKNLDGIECETILRSEKANDRYYLSNQWSYFRQINDLLEGDECVFKFIRNESTLLLAKVTRKKPRALDPRLSNGTPTTEAAKRKRGQQQPVTDDGVSATEVEKRKKVQPEVVKRTRR